MPACASSSSRPGFCQETFHFAAGSCSTDTVGQWPGVRTADECVQRCRQCDGCAYTSFSREYSDCSWFTHCDMTRLRQASTDHCTQHVRAVSSSLMSYCAHSGFANQLFALLAAAWLAAHTQLVLLLRPILLHQTYWPTDLRCYETNRVSDFMDACTAPGWSNGSSSSWHHVLRPSRLPCRTTTNGMGIATGTRIVRRWVSNSRQALQHSPPHCVSSPLTVAASGPLCGQLQMVFQPPHE